MTEAQRTRLLDLISQWSGIVNDRFAAPRLARRGQITGQHVLLSCGGVFDAGGRGQVGHSSGRFQHHSTWRRQLCLLLAGFRSRGIDSLLKRRGASKTRREVPGDHDMNGGDGVLRPVGDVVENTEDELRCRQKPTAPEAFTGFVRCGSESGTRTARTLSARIRGDPATSCPAGDLMSLLALAVRPYGSRNRRNRGDRCWLAPR